MEKRNGFSLIELLVVITIISILSGFGIYWFLNYKFAREVEDRTYKIYALLKKYQLLAKAKKETYKFEASDSKFIVEDSASSQVAVVNTAPLKVILNASPLRVNEFGIFETKGSVYFESASNKVVNCETENLGISYCCIAISDAHVCLGKYDGSKCNCSY